MPRDQLKCQTKYFQPASWPSVRGKNVRNGHNRTHTENRAKVTEDAAKDQETTGDDSEMGSTLVCKAPKPCQISKTNMPSARS